MRYTISFRKLWFIVAVYIAMDLLCITFHDYLPEWFQFAGTEESLAKDLNRGVVRRGSVVILQGEESRMRAPVHHTEEDIKKKMIAESRRQMMLNAKVVETEEVHAPKVTTSPPVNPVEVARAEYWREYRQRWLAVAMAVAGGMLGGALVLQIEMWREWMY